MDLSQKEKQVQQSLIKAVELYLSERYDETGYCYIKDLTVSKDGKRATVFIVFKDDPEKLRIDRSALTEIIKQQVKLRYIPKMDFIKLIDED